MNHQLTSRAARVLLLALFVAVLAFAHFCQPQNAHAATTADPFGYRRCRLTEIQADPLHKVCKIATWTEGRNGWRVTFRAYVRKIKVKP